MFAYFSKSDDTAKYDFYSDSITRKKYQKSVQAIGSCTCKMKVDTHKSVGVYFFRSIMNMERK